MKRNLALILSLVFLLSTAAMSAKVDSNANIADGKNAYGTFANAKLVTDGKTKGVVYATSGDITDTPQYLTIDLGTAMYLDRVKIFWDKNALSNSFSIKTSADAKYWQEEASNVDASTGVLDNVSGTIVMSVSLKGKTQYSKYLQIMIPAGTSTSNTRGNNVRIAEIEVYPAAQQNFVMGTVDMYALTNDACYMKYGTSIGAAGGSAVYGLDPAKMNKVAVNANSGLENSIALTGLSPKTIYFCQVKATDFYGQITGSKVISFTTPGENVALKKTVTGTFTNLPPRDALVVQGNGDQVLSRATDGKTGYFASMATSGSIPTADQYVIVDLGKTYALKNIVSFWRKLAYPESLTVQVSDNNTTWTTVAENVNCGNGVYARTDQGDPMVAVNSPASSARYIKLLVKKGSQYFHKHSDWDFVQLMEVKAFE
jgi:hypothetical protein